MPRYIMTLLAMTLALPVPACPHLELGTPAASDQILCREGYALGYSYALKSAEWVAYRLERETRPGVVRQDSFRPDPDLPVRYQTTPADYDEPVYHQGHLANSESIDRTVTANAETFLMSNIVPQLPRHNTGIWKGLENRERKWADRFGEVWVFQGVLYEPQPETIGNRVPVPDAFWKVVYEPQGQRAISYLIPHRPLYTRDLPRYRTSVDVIEAAAGMDLLSSLPTEQQAQIEAKPEPYQWPTR